MKRITCTILCTLLSFIAISQNQVLNGSFENYSNCPANYSQLANCTGWRQYTGGTSDYFNTCATTSTVRVPANSLGYQVPAHGNAYAGLIDYAPGTYKEYIAGFIVPMTIGMTYEVSMSVSLSNFSGYTINDLGVWFYDNGPTSIGGTAGLTVTPQISYTSLGTVTDTNTWVRVRALFTADSAYDNIVIGGFGSATPGTTGHGSGVGAGYAYYYIDSVVIRKPTGIENLYLDSLICAGDTFNVPYVVNGYVTFNTGNIFRVQLSNSSGSFSSGTSIIGTRTATTSGNIQCVVPSSITPGNNYRLRILATNTSDTSHQSYYSISIGNVRPVVSCSSNAPVCAGQALQMSAVTTPSSGINYRWMGPNNYNSMAQNPLISSFALNMAGDYVVTARLFGCISKDTTTVTAITAQYINAMASNPPCISDTLRLYAIANGSPTAFSWTGPSGFTSSARDTFMPNSTSAYNGNYILTVNYGSCSFSDTVNVFVQPHATGRTISSNTPLCPGDTLRLSASSTTSGVSHGWTGPNGFTAFVQNPSLANVSSLSAGNYVAYTNLNGCISRDTTIVVINPSPTAITATATTPICERDTMRLFSTNSSTGVTWAWTGPGSYTASTQNPVRVSSTPSMSGDYIITATNSFSCTAKDTVTVLVKPLPANFNATAGTICEGSTLFLTGNSTSTGVTWSWTGPNSFTSTLQNPNISSAATVASGAYILTATLNGCSDKDTAFGTVFPIPATPVPSANTPVCTGQDLKLTATNINGASFLWTSTTGYSSALQNPILSTATTAMAGKYYVQATANGCTSGIDSVTVTVNPAPVINMYPSPNDSICQGATLTFVSSQSNAGSAFQRTWYRNNNPITGANGVNYVTTAAIDSDVYYVSLTGGNCAEPFTDTSSRILIRVFPWLAPKVSITANPTTTVPSGTMINFTATPTNGGNNPTYQWTRNGANIVGALSNVWGAPNLSNNDEICVNMTSSYLCPNPKTTKSNCIRVSIETTGIKGTWVGKQPAIYPNPVKDVLIIEGISTGTIIQLTDVAGRTLIRKTAISNNETINTQSLIPGNYILLLDDNKGSNIRVKITKE